MLQGCVYRVLKWKWDKPHVLVFDRVEEKERMANKQVVLKKKGRKIMEKLGQALKTEKDLLIRNLV